MLWGDWDRRDDDDDRFHDRDDHGAFHSFSAVHVWVST